MIKTLIALLFIPSLALAQQQQPDVNALNKAIAVLQQQRNQAMDAQAANEVRLILLSEEIAKLKAEIEELKKRKSDAQ